MSATDSIEEDQESRRSSVRPNQHGPLERVTVNLAARASRALDQAAQLTGDSKTDTINRALQVYAYFEQVTHDGGDVYVRESPEGELRLLKMFLWLTPK